MGNKGKSLASRVLLRRTTTIRQRSAAKTTACHVTMFGLATAGVALAIANSLYVAKPMKGLLASISRVTTGDFETKVDVPSAGPARKPLQEFNEMTSILSKAANDRENYFVNVSHEFKEPLARIQQLAALLQADSLSEEDRETCLAGIISDTRRLSRMVSSMLELTIANSSDSPLEKDEYSLDEQLRQALIPFASLMDQKGISYSADLADVSIRANECLLDEAWANIISNAVKFTDRGGSVHVSLRAMGNLGYIVIADTGVGMDSEELDGAFERFYRSKTTTQEGTGLGLPIAKAIIERHEGTIRLDSSPGEGTSCTVTLPLR